MLGRTNSSFAAVAGGGALALISSATLPEVALRTVCVVTTETVESIVMRTTAPAHTLGRVWVEIEEYGERGTISNGGGVMFRLHQAWRSNGTDWVPVNAYYSLWDEWVQFSHDYVELGIEWDYSQATPLLTRIEDAASFNASAGVGVVPGSSDFDTMPIFGDIVRVNLADNGTINAYEGDAGFSLAGTNGQVMVQIPKYYYKTINDSTNSKLRYLVCNHAADGYAVHPMFTHGDAEQDYVYVAAYEMGAGYVSKTGVAPLVSLTRGAFRTGVRGARGDHWSLIDVATRVGIGMLMAIEFATFNMQAAIGPGVSGTSAASATGQADGVAGTSGRAAGTANQCSVVWRGIENWWGNVWEFIDGLNFNSGTFHYCLNQLDFADDTATNYAALGYTVGTSLSESYATRLGYDAYAPWALLPSAHSGGSDGTYLCDACWSSTGWRVAHAGGSWTYAGVCGPWAWSWANASSSAIAYSGGRLLFVP